MTYREKARIEHPESFGSEFYGGVAGCPSAYGYGDRPDFCRGVGIYECEKCWNREIPEEKNPIVESKHKTVCDRCYSSGICKYSDALNSELHAIKNIPPFITIYVKCEYFNDRKENV